jgi:hypothetical protein
MWISPEEAAARLGEGNRAPRLAGLAAKCHDSEAVESAEPSRRRWQHSGEVAQRATPYG